MEACAGAGSQNAAEKDPSYAAAGSTKAETAERARLMLKNLELDDEETTHAGSKTEKEKKKVQQNPVPDDDFPFSSEPWAAPKGGQSKAGRNRRKKTYRLGKEYVDYVAENPDLPPPLYLPDPRYSYLCTNELARQKAERQERESIIKQIEEFGYADVEVEVLDLDEDPLCGGGIMDGY